MVYVHPILKNGITKGFRFNFKEKRTIRIQDNLKSIDIELSALTEYIKNKIALGWMCSFFTLDNPPYSSFQINPYVVVEKKGSNPKVYRVISHLSTPHDESINDSIDSTEFATKYKDLNYAV